jgi:hypothetical protein
MFPSLSLPPPSGGGDYPSDHDRVCAILNMSLVRVTINESTEHESTPRRGFSKTGACAHRTGCGGAIVRD